MTTSSEDVTFTPGRTSKVATLHHSPQEQIINNYWRRERKVMCFVNYDQLPANQLLVYAENDSKQLICETIRNHYFIFFNLAH